MSAPSSNRRFRFACVVLAAGAGRRFGGPKALAELKPGERFLDAVVGIAAEADANPVVAVVQRGTEVPAPARRVEAPNPTDEQISSLRLGLAQLTGVPVTGALVWPVDHPFVTLRTVLAVVDAHQRTGAPIVVPAYGGRRGHPVFFDRSTWRELMTVSEGGARAVVHTYGERVLAVEAGDPGVLRDIDTRADLVGGGSEGNGVSR